MSRVKYIVLLALLISAFSIFAIGQKTTPATVVTGFYAYDRSHSQTFNRKNLDARKGWLSAKLSGLFLNELKRQRQYIKQNPTDKPHFGDGLPFQPLDETCESNRRKYRRQQKVLRSHIRRNNAYVIMAFAYPKQCRIEQTVYSVRLIKSKGGWVIDDIEFPDSATLVKDLSRETY